MSKELEQSYDNPNYEPDKDVEGHSSDETKSKKKKEFDENDETSKPPSLIGISSFHGVIQAYLHKNIFNRVCWSVCLFICIVGFSVHLWSLLDRFIGLPTTIDMISDVIYDPFPAVTICPQTTLSLSKYESIAFKPIPQFDNSTLSKIMLTEIMGKWKEVYTALGEDLIDPRIVGRYWDRTERSIYRLQNVINYDLSRHNYEMILFCEINNKPCSFRNFKEIDTYEHQRCFSFKSPYENEIPEQLTVVVIYNDDKKRSTEDIDSITSQIGFFVTLNEQEIYPGTTRSFQRIPDSGNSEIRIKQEGLIKVSKNHAPCLTEKVLYRSVYNDYEFNNSLVDKVNYNHNLITCRHYHLQKAFVERCGCINSDFPNFVDAIKGNSSLKFCDYMLPNTNITDIVNNFKCIDKVYEDVEFIAQLSKLCYSSCDQIEYVISSYNMPWIGYTLNNEADFLQEKIDRYLEDVKDVVNITASLPIQSMLKCKKDTSYLGCFSLLRVIFESPRKEIVREYEAYLLRNFFSDLGGIMGLWLGVSLVTIIEIIQVTINVSKENSKKTVKSIKKKSMKRSSMKQKSIEEKVQQSSDISNDQMD